MSLSRSNLGGAVDRKTVRGGMKLLLGAGSLVFLLYLVTLVPGVERVIPDTPISFVGVVSVIVTAAIVVVLVNLAAGVKNIAPLVFNGPAPLGAHLASMGHWLVMLVAVLIAHRGLQPAVAPVLGDAMWIYDLGFLLMALPALVIIAFRLYFSLDQMADLLTNRIIPHHR